MLVRMPAAMLVRMPSAMLVRMHAYPLLIHLAVKSSDHSKEDLLHF